MNVIVAGKAMNTKKQHREKTNRDINVLAVYDGDEDTIAVMDVPNESYPFGVDVAMMCKVYVNQYGVSFKYLYDVRVTGNLDEDSNEFPPLFS